MSQAEYDKLFHEATVQAGKDMDKPFDELQKEDLAKAKQETVEKEKQDAQDAAEKKAPLDKQNLDTGKIETQDGDPQQLGEVPMDTAMAYTDEAADKGEAFGTAATRNMTKKATPAVKKEPPKVVDKTKSFYEQVLDEELKKDPSALAELAKPLDLEQKADEAKKQKEAEKPLAE